MTDNIRNIVSRALAGSRKQQGWTCLQYSIPEPAIEGDEYVYSVKLNFKRRSLGLNDAQEFARLVEMASGACGGNGRWEVVGDVPIVKVAKEKREIGKLNTNIGHHFSQIFDRRSQIENYSFCISCL